MKPTQARAESKEETQENDSVGAHGCHLLETRHHFQISSTSDILLPLF